MQRVEYGEIPTNLALQYKHLAFDEFVDRPAFFYSSTSEWAEKTEKVTALLAEAFTKLSRIDVPFALAEFDFLGKMAACWRHKGKGTLIAEEAVVTCSSSSQLEMRAGMRQLGNHYVASMAKLGASTVATIMANATIPIAKGKGSPFWKSGADTLFPEYALAAIRDCRDYSDIQNKLIRLSQFKIPICSTSYGRIDSSAKRGPAYIEQNGRLVQDGDLVLPKRRRVLAQSFVENCLWTPISKVARHIQQYRSFAHTGNIVDVCNIARRYKYRLAADKSKYDTNMSAELLTLFRTEIAIPMLDWCVRSFIMTRKERSILLDIDSYKLTIPVLCPSSDIADAAVLIPSSGTNKSGDRRTSWIATDCNKVVTDMKMKTLGLTGYICTFGDDTLVLSDSAELYKWADDLNFLDFPETIAVDPSFLMRRVPDDVPYLARIVSSTLNREPNQEPVNLFEAALSYKVRRSLVQGHPMARYFDLCFDIIAAEKRSAIRSLAQLSDTQIVSLILSSRGTRTEAATTEFIESLERSTVLADLGSLDNEDATNVASTDPSRYVTYSDLLKKANAHSVAQASQWLAER